MILHFKKIMRVNKLNIQKSRLKKKINRQYLKVSDEKILERLPDI
jgi:hypothetical protein